jgi:polyisoprenoid-binding protein YceI
MAPANGVVQFAIDARASLFTVQAFASGIVSVVAHSPKFAMRDVTGQIKMDLHRLENSSAHMLIKLASLEIMDEVTSADRREIERVMFGEVLESSVYPTTEFRSSRVTGAKTGDNLARVTIAGDITLHGVTRDIAFDSQLVTGEETLRAQGAFSLRQSDFGLTIASVAGGALKLKDELKFGFFVIARRKN